VCSDSEKHRGFAFVEFALPEDAVAALDNMNDSELYGRVLKINLAKPASMKGSGAAVWAGEAADEWYGNTVAKNAEAVDAAIQHQINTDAKSRQ